MSADVVQQIVSVIAIALATAVALLIKELSKMGVAYLQSKIGATNFAHLKETIDILVRGIEQSPFAVEWDGAKKKEMVLAEIKSWLESKGLSYADTLIDQMVEAAVQVMNSYGETVTIVGEPE